MEKLELSSGKMETTKMLMRYITKERTLEGRRIEIKHYFH